MPDKNQPVEIRPDQPVEFLHAPRFMFRGISRRLVYPISLSMTPASTVGWLECAIVAD